jgi:hypothetical protein
METPGGAWVSPITSELIVSQSISLGTVALSPGGDVLFWLEGRPKEGGRYVMNSIKCAQEGADGVQVTPGPDSGLNLRSRVQEYGGGDSLVVDGALYFTNFS